MLQEREDRGDIYALISPKMLQGRQRSFPSITRSNCSRTSKPTEQEHNANLTTEHLNIAQKVFDGNTETASPFNFALVLAKPMHMHKQGTFCTLEFHL